MSVATFGLPNFPVQDPATYKANIDADFMVAKRLIDAFAPHAQTVPDMTVAVDAGFSLMGNTLTETTAQNTSAFSASSRAGITRIDRVVTDMVTGAVSVVAGTSVAPALPIGKYPNSQVALTTASTAITNAMLTDERAFPTGRVIDYQPFTTTGAFTWNAPTGFSSNALVIAHLFSGGAGGHATSTNGGGGGGSMLMMSWRLGQLSTSVAGSVGAGGTVGNGGGPTSFNGTTVYGGNSPPGATGGGGGGLYSGGSAGQNTGGSPVGGGSGPPGGDSVYGGGGGGNASNGGNSVFGGGGGSGAGASLSGGRSIYGGGGGSGGTAGIGGVSAFAGNGGNTGAPGTAPSGGGGSGAAGARGEVRIWVLP